MVLNPESKGGGPACRGSKRALVGCTGSEALGSGRRVPGDARGHSHLPPSAVGPRNFPFFLVDWFSDGGQILYCPEVGVQYIESRLQGTMGPFSSSQHIFGKGRQDAFETLTLGHYGPLFLAPTIFLGRSNRTLLTPSFGSKSTNSFVENNYW